MAELKIKVENASRRVVIEEGFDFQSDSSSLIESVETMFLQHKQIIIDLGHILYPHPSLIAYLIELTSRLRRQGGELIISNITDTARMNFMTFSPFSYLKVVSEDQEPDLSAAPLDPGDPPLKVEAPQKEDLSFKIKDPQPKPAAASRPPEPIQSPPPSDAAFSLDLDSDELGFEDLVEDKPTQLRPPENGHIVVHSREDQLYKLTDFVVKMAQRAGFESSEISRIKISVYEAAANVIEHAYQYDAGHFIEMFVKYDSSQFSITLMDRGIGFDFDPDKDYDAVEAAEEKRTGGFGLHIIRRSMDDVQYVSDPKWGNKLTMVKRLS